LGFLVFGCPLLGLAACQSLTKIQEMAKNLGQVAAVLYGTAPPANLKVIWGETDNNNPLTQTVINFKRWDAATSQWVVISEGEIEWQSTNW
jgi:hypothetical protein